MSHDGRHGVARHHAPQQHQLLRTGHRQTSDIASVGASAAVTMSHRALSWPAVGTPDHRPDHAIVLVS